MNELTLTINGKEERVSGVSPTLPLLSYLRQRGLVGTKEGCAEGDCGACTVAIVEQKGEDGPSVQAVNSCLIPLASVADKTLITVEGVSNGTLHPVQKAMVETGGSQCGYCTPGFVMSLFAAYYSGERDDTSIEGNLCRCTGYLPIRKALTSLGEPQLDDPFLQSRSTASEARASTYEHGVQRFYRPTTLDEVFVLLSEPDATLIAGGTDLGVEINKFHKDYSVLVSLEEVRELRTIEDTSRFLELGAAVPLTQIETQCRGMFPTLDEMLRWFAARQIRNRATLGGNLGTASPIGDLPPVLLALDAELKLASVRGERFAPVAEFFKGYRQTSLEPGEVIVSVRIPKRLPADASERFSQAYKVGKRGADDISIVAAAFTVDVDDAGHVIKARLAYGGVAVTPLRAVAAEEVLTGQPWTIQTVREVREVLGATFKPIDDLRGSASYRTKLIQNLFEKFFHDFTLEPKVAA